MAKEWLLAFQVNSQQPLGFMQVVNVVVYDQRSLNTAARMTDSCIAVLSVNLQRCLLTRVTRNPSHYAWGWPGISKTNAQLYTIGKQRRLIFAMANCVYPSVIQNCMAHFEPF